MMTKNLDGKITDRSIPLFWTAAAFYALIAFEFFYMASPFAAYFYSVYGPGMDWLQALPVADWTLWFFLPHLVEDTKSVVINSAETVGIVLFIGGLAAFAVGAFQVYRAKLLGTGAVIGGIYRYVRHPQYAALIIASIGMLLIWPRFLVLFSTACVILAYVLLARAEERQCLRLYPGYADYLTKTGMFAPRILRWQKNLGMQTMRGRVWGTIGLFSAIVGLSTLAAFGIRSAAMSSLYLVDTETGVFLSVAEIEDDDLVALAQIVLSDEAAAAAISDANADGHVLAYVLPTQMYVSEIPMELACAGTLGCAASIVGVANQSKIQLSIPDGFHGRVMGLWVMVGLGSTALGTIVYGTISNITNLRDASAIISVIGITSVGAIFLKSRE